MIKCLLCSRSIAQNFLFSELFLLKIFYVLNVKKILKRSLKLTVLAAVSQMSMRSVLIVKIGKKEDTKSDIRQFFTTIKQ